MGSIIEEILRGLKITHLDKERIKEANFYIDLLLESESDLRKQANFHLVKIKLLRRWQKLDNEKSGKGEKRILAGDLFIIPPR
jgi:hypothetical protein